MAFPEYLYLDKEKHFCEINFEHDDDDDAFYFFLSYDSCCWIFLGTVIYIL